MEFLELIKSRIQSITNTRQITQSMRLVSTAKVQKARVLMEANRPFLLETERLVRIAAENASNPRHPYLKQGDQNRSAVIVISGDRGLCGGYNMNVNRRAADLIKSLGGDVRIVSVGIKARDFCRRRYKQALVKSYTGISENPLYEDVREIASPILGWYDSGEVGRIYVVYTQFETMLTQTAVDRLLLPLEADTPAAGGLIKLTRCEPDGDAFLARAIPFYLTACLFGAITEASSCEQSARIVSMDAAVKNADEIIGDLTLLYNQARQDAITQEITEIVGGAEVVR